MMCASVAVTSLDARLGSTMQPDSAMTTITAAMHIRKLAMACSRCTQEQVGRGHVPAGCSST
jgi:hypothetical protein